jgi:hypothetical protein
MSAYGCSKAGAGKSSVPESSKPETQSSKRIAKNATTEELIDSLCDLDSIAVGLHPTAFSTGFLAGDDDPAFSGGVLGSQAPQPNPAMKRLVQLGVDAIPALVAHISDKRPTRLKVGSQFPIMAKWFDEEYDPRSRVNSDNPEGDQGRGVNGTVERSFDEDYVVKVGDVCYVLIGQIVNRNLLAVRYQPSGCMVVNSPIESPILGERIARDWGTLTMRDHVESLTADLESSDSAWGGVSAFLRLRYYYPNELASLREGKMNAVITEIERSKSR